MLRLAMGPFPPLFCCDDSDLILGIVLNVRLDFSDLPLYAAPCSLYPAFCGQTSAACRATRRFLDSPLGLFESSFGSILCAWFHN